MIRIFSAIVLIPIVLGAIWFAPHWAMIVLVEAVLVAAAIEYVALADKSGVPVPRTATIAVAAIVCAGVAWHQAPLEVILVAALLAGGLTVLASYQPAAHVPATAAATLFPALYLGVPLGSLAVLRDMYGREALLLVLLVIWVSDTAQFYVGSTLGKRRLSPTISPKKSVEGAIGGFVAGIALTVALGRLWLPQFDLFRLVALGVLLVALGITGDLFESLLKRSANVKDSSGLIPGHGGVLDRIDALLPALPVATLLVVLMS